MLTKADEGGRGVSQILTIADVGGMGGPGKEPLILADVICEQPLIAGGTIVQTTTNN